MNNWTITNKIAATARAAQRGTTPRHSWTIGTFTRFPRFSRFATRKRKRSLRRLIGTFMEPFALSLRIFPCFFCVFCALFSGTCRFFRWVFHPGLHSKHSGRKWGGPTSFGIFPWYFPLYAKLNLSQEGIVVNTGTPVFSWASNEFFRQLFGFPVWLKLRSPPKI